MLFLEGLSVIEVERVKKYEHSFPAKKYAVLPIILSVLNCEKALSQIGVKQTVNLHRATPVFRVVTGWKSSDSGPVGSDASLFIAVKSGIWECLRNYSYRATQ
jgi:hypothetical protein